MIFRGNQRRTISRWPWNSILLHTGKWKRGNLINVFLSPKLPISFTNQIHFWPGKETLGTIIQLAEWSLEVCTAFTKLGVLLRQNKIILQHYLSTSNFQGSLYFSHKHEKLDKMCFSSQGYVLTVYVNWIQTQIFVSTKNVFAWHVSGRSTL